MKRKHRRKRQKDTGISTEMMVDVLFILLIFFILISNIKKDNVKIKATQVDKQESSASDKQTEEHILTIDKENNIYYDGKQVKSSKDLLPLLKQTKKNIKQDYVPVVTLRTDASSSSGKLLEVFVFLNEAGLADNVQCEVDTNTP